LAQVISDQPRLLFCLDQPFQLSTSYPDLLLSPQDFSIAMLFSHALCVSLVVVAASTNCTKKEDYCCATNCGQLPCEPGWCGHGCAQQYGGGGSDYKCLCNLKCSDTCTGPGLFGRWCDEYKNCTNGCIDGYYDGISVGCNLKCPGHCNVIMRNGRCNKASGRCVHGCAQGYGGDGDDHDSSCGIKCPDNCKAPKADGDFGPTGRWCDAAGKCTNGMEIGANGTKASETSLVV